MSDYQIITDERLAEIFRLLVGDLATARAELADLRAKVDHLHTLNGIIGALDRHYPSSVFPTTHAVDEPDRDLGPRVVSLIRWIGELQSENADLRAYKERTEAGLGAKPRGWAQLRDALERREKAAKSEDNRACWWWALKEMDAIEAMFSKANPPQAEVQP